MDATEDSIKDALAKLIVMENLPFTFVESKYLIEMLALYDENVRINLFLFLYNSNCITVDAA